MSCQARAGGESTINRPVIAVLVIVPVVLIARGPSSLPSILSWLDGVHGRPIDVIKLNIRGRMQPLWEAPSSAAQSAGWRNDSEQKANVMSAMLPTIH